MPFGSYQDRMHDRYIMSLKNVSHALKVPKIIQNRCVQLFEYLKSSQQFQHTVKQSELLASILFLICVEE